MDETMMGRCPRRVADDAAVTWALEWDGPVATAVGGPLGTTAAQRMACAYLGDGGATSPGIFLIPKGDPLAPAVMQVRYSLKRAELAVVEELMVSLDVIRQVNAAAEGRAAPVPPSVRPYKLTLSVDEGVSKRAQDFAKRQGTSVSALVEDYLSELIDGARPTAEEASEEDIATLSAFDGAVLTAENGPVVVTAEQRRVGAYLDNGWLVLWRGDPMSPAAAILRQQVRRAGHRPKRLLLVDVGTLAALYAADEKTGTEVMREAFLAMLAEAASEGASDIHVVSNRWEASIRLRVDGVMRPLRQVKSSWANALCAAAFAAADTVDAGYRPADFQQAACRRAVLPADVRAVRLQFNPLPEGGRYMVCHLVYGGGQRGDLAQLGYNEAQIDVVRRLRDGGAGLVVLGGHCGSGRSTTLQSVLTDFAKRDDMMVVTVEDPPEYVIPGAVQIPCGDAVRDIERTEQFNRAIRSALRRRPDVVMIGEVRDRAALELAIQAAEQGSLVFTTVHADDAIKILPRLAALGVDTQRLVGAMRGVWSQRLVRKLCPECRVPLLRRDNEALYDWLEAVAPYAPRTAFVAGAGCPCCRGGYAGRTVVAEVVESDYHLASSVVLHGEITSARRRLKARPGASMFRHALEKVAAGEVSPADVHALFGDRCGD